MTYDRIKRVQIDAFTAFHSLFMIISTQLLKFYKIIKNLCKNIYFCGTFFKQKKHLHVFVC
jgi:hypothetical protein